MNLETQRQEWLKKHENRDTRSSELIALNEEIIAHSISILPQAVEGIFGDYNRNKGYVDKSFRTEKGIQTKFLGCSILALGNYDRSIVDSVASLKRVWIVALELVLKYKWTLFFEFFWRYKKTLKELIMYALQPYETDLKQKTFQSLADFSPVSRELIRAGLKLSENIPLENKPKDEWGNPGGEEFRVKIQRLFWCLGTFIQADPAYYWRVSDPLANLDKGLLQANPHKEILRLFDLAISREHQIVHKLLKMRRFVSYGLLFPPFKEILVTYLQELDTEQFKLDRDDRYWSYLRSGYDVEGKPFEERLRWAKNLDKDLKNVIIETL